MIKTESDFRLQLPFSIISMHLHFCPSSGPGPNLLLKSGRDMTGHVTSAASQQWVDILLPPEICTRGGCLPTQIIEELTRRYTSIEERTANSRNFRDVLFVPQTARRLLKPNASQRGRETELFLVALFNNSHNERSKYHE
jgi:hypothetical protein